MVNFKKFLTIYWYNLLTKGKKQYRVPVIILEIF